MIEVVCNDRLGKKVRVKCNEDDTVGDLKKLIAAQVGTRPEKIRFVSKDRWICLHCSFLSAVVRYVLREEKFLK
jgi:hypothetical protein